ncbi:MAG TPA: amino acid adenylation domain-containing protein [Pseudoxanthomonas sp.]
MDALQAAVAGPQPGQWFPLTDAQSEKWLGSRYNAQAALAFGESCELRFDGPLDHGALVRAFTHVFRRHEAFSMRFEGDGSGQVYQPPSPAAVEELDFSGEGDPDAAYARHIQQQAAIPFDPSRPPLVRVQLCRLSALRSRLLLFSHHLVVDGWSLHLVLRELVALYNARNGGVPVRLPAADSWSGYVLAERARREGPQGQRSLQYWREQFRDIPEPLRLPTDHPRGSQLSFSAANLCLDIPASLWNDLRAAARTQKVTRFSLLLTGYFLLLYRLTGQTDLVGGIPFAGAAQGGGARVVGDTDNTMPLRVRIDPDEPVQALARRVQVALKEAAEHQDISLGRIVDALQLPREPGRLMLVESIVSLAPAMDRLDFDGVECTLNVMPRLASAWELSFRWWQKPGQATLELQYHRDLYDEATVAAWADVYVDILGKLSQGADSTAAGLELNSDVSRPLSFALINDKGHARGAPASLPGLLDASFAEFAGRCAVQCGDGEMDYAALDRASRDMATGLRKQGIGRGQLVGICMPRSLDMLVSVLAVMRAGAAYVPLDPAFPEERLRYMVEHARISHVIASAPALVPTGVADGRALLLVDALKGSGEAGGELPAVAAEDLAYVLYTSGSTGEPKGVCIVHANLVNFLLSMRESPGFGADDALCSATTLSFDIAALELYLPLLCGGRVVIADDNEHRDPEALCRLIERRACTVLQTTPSLIAILQEVGRMDVLQPLRLFVGGEAMPAALANALLPRCRELWNMYGPTETTVWSSIERLRPGQASVPLGKPIDNTRIYLLDARRQPALPGALGEIWIGGAGVAQGYLHRADLTAERFVADPFAGDGSRMYRTGDIGRIRDGRLFFNGRVDDQIKLRGYRIEPGDIEAVAAQEPGVNECAVIARPLEGGDLVLVLYAGSELGPAALSARLRQRFVKSLPAYMRPHHVVVVRALPKTPNGKIDRRALPAPDPEEAASTSGYVAPRDELEESLCLQWRQLLQREQVGIHDNFFDLGGYSLLAVRMFTELHLRHYIDLPLATLIEHPTVAGLAEVMRAAGVDVHTDCKSGSALAQSWKPLVALQAGRGREPLFLFHAVGGNVMNYRPLLVALTSDQPVYGLQSIGLDGVTPTLKSIEEMADAYTREIRAMQPHGPYSLAGGSMGGVIALEVARKLKAEGEPIALLAMFDTYGPGSGVAMKLGWLTLERWRRLSARISSEFIVQLVRRARLRLLQLPWAKLRHALSRDPGSLKLSPEVRLYHVEQANMNALNQYRPSHYDGRITLFRTRLQGASEDPSMGWHAWAREGMDIIELPGRHDNFIAQPELAARLREFIDAGKGLAA